MGGVRAALTLAAPPRPALAGVPSAFVVEQQPTMPNAGKRPLVLRTATKFSARARLLVRLHDRNRRMEAKIHIDRSGYPLPPRWAHAAPHYLPPSPAAGVLARR